MRSIGYLVLLTVLYAGFTSCQKEITGLVTVTDSTGGGSTVPGSTNGDLLVKSYGRSGADSNVTTYTYNSAKKLIATYNVMSANSGSTTYYGFERDSTGLIVRRKQFTTSGLIPASPDTSVTVYHYSTGTTKQIIYSTSSIVAFGFSVDDSTVYTYNTVGKLTKTESYQSSILTGASELSSRNTFTYDASGNVSTMVASGFLAGVPVSTITYTYTYDSKTSPETYTEAEAIAISSGPVATHNPTGFQAVSTTAGTISSTNIYTYNTSNRPATSKQTVTQGTASTITNYTFYYQ